MHKHEGSPVAKMDGEQSIGVGLPTTDLKPEELLPLMDTVAQQTIYPGYGYVELSASTEFLAMNLDDDYIEHGPVGDPGPVGDIGPPGQEPVPFHEDEESTSPKIQLPSFAMDENMKAITAKVMGTVFPEWTGPSGSEMPEGVLEEAEAKAKALNKGISLQDIITSKKVAATETGAVVLMPQEFDADNVKAYIQQEIEAGVKEHQTALMRKVADVLADTITEERKATRAAAIDAAHEQSCRVGDLRAYLDAHRLEAEEFDKKRALDIAELQIKVAELEGSLTLKVQETKVLREKLHAASLKKPVRKIRKVNSALNREHGTSKAGNDP